MMNNLKLGQLGEEIAKEYLHKKGFEILEHNCKNKYGEIDLVCRVGAIPELSTIIFVEVKTRIGEQFGGPEGALNREKVRRLVRNAQAYMIRLRSGHKLGELNSPPTGGEFSSPSFRIDVICIVLDQDKKVKRINHYQNITG